MAPGGLPSSMLPTPAAPRAPARSAARLAQSFDLGRAMDPELLRSANVQVFDPVLEASATPLAELLTRVRAVAAEGVARA